MRRPHHDSTTGDIAAIASAVKHLHLLTMEHPFLKPAPVCETAERAGVDNTLNKQ
ncbi:hypothetical protein AB2H05_08980 [Escherichia coli]